MGDVLIGALLRWTISELPTKVQIQKMKIKNLIFIRTLRPQLAAKFDTYKYSNRYSSISRVSNHAIFVSLDFSRFIALFMSLYYIVIYGA